MTHWQWLKAEWRSERERSAAYTRLRRAEEEAKAEVRSGGRVPRPVGADGFVGSRVA